MNCFDIVKKYFLKAFLALKAVNKQNSIIFIFLNHHNFIERDNFKNKENVILF